MALEIGGQWRQAGGGTRYAMDEADAARRARAALRADPAIADTLSPAVVVTRAPDGKLWAEEWPCRTDGMLPPWAEIHAALATT